MTNEATIVLSGNSPLDIEKLIETKGDLYINSKSVEFYSFLSVCLGMTSANNRDLNWLCRIASNEASRINPVGSIQQKAKEFVEQNKIDKEYILKASTLKKRAKCLMHSKSNEEFVKAISKKISCRSKEVDVKIFPRSKKNSEYRSML